MTTSVLEILFERLHRMMLRCELSSLIARLGSFGSGSVIDLPTVINGAENVHIGSNVHINSFVHIWGHGGLEIGNDTLIASHVSITTLTHDTQSAQYRKSVISKPVTIGNNVWIGTHAVILPGVTIGQDAIIGAAAVVTANVAPGTIVIGIPARFLRNRYPFHPHIQEDSGTSTKGTP
jgi:acetyltransferase-like isoleucine patch superfamily enzyme